MFKISRNTKLLLSGAFVVGVIYGSFLVAYPWRGEGLVANLGLLIGTGLGLVILMTIVTILWTIIHKVAALVHRKHISH